MPVIEDEALKEREEGVARRRRGMAGTIVTSARGVLSDTSSAAPTRKTLLGE